MKYPTLNYPRLCRILTYVVVVGAGLLPILIVFQFPVPDAVKIIVLFASLLGLLAYLVKNFIVLMSMDIYLAMMSCYRTARTQYSLPERRTAEAIRKSIIRYGIQCEPAPLKPQPAALRYKFEFPMTIYSRGIEKVVAAYEVDMLNREVYRGIFSSAKRNSMSLIGKKKALFLDKEQKKQSLHRVTVVLILAHKVDPEMIPSMYKIVCNQCGDENEDCLVPCVVDLEHHTCVFNCLRLPYVGFGYPVKNRGIRIIKNRVFGGALPLTDEYTIPSIDDIDPETSLWDFWKDLHHEMVGAERKTKRQFEAMTEREIRMVGDVLYLKWDQRGICLTVDEAKDKTVRIEAVENWAYPKSQPIGKKTILKIEEHITDYFGKQGYSVEYKGMETFK